MYVSAAFAETNLVKLHDFIEEFSFGLLVTQVEGQPFASHLPFLLERGAGAQGTLVGHMARANPQWREAQGQPALVVFSGPHAYVSPTWYQAEKVVPTWNYTAVHASGRVRIFEEADALEAIVRKSVEHYEQGMREPWSFDGSSTFARKLLAQIVGFRIEIDRLEGKWKLNQNQPSERRARVARVLSQSPLENHQSVARLMQARLDQEE